MPATKFADPVVAGELTITRVSALIARLPDVIRPHAEDLMTRHGYSADVPGRGPHVNVLGHPLFHLPIWVDAATKGTLDTAIMADVLESSLCGYLSVRAEDDYFDGQWDRPKEAMMLSVVFRSRHQALLAKHIDDDRFWSRFEQLWRDYADAMLFESDLNHLSSEYELDEFERVLSRSQPLEIPADAVLALKGLCDLQTSRITELVRRLTRATQLFDDFVDAPDDLAAGNYTWIVRRLGGGQGVVALRRNMVTTCDEVFAEAYDELDEAITVATEMGLVDVASWVAARKAEMAGAAERMYEALFEGLGAFGDPGESTTA